MVEKKVRSVFIVEPESQSWIIEILMRDIAEQLEAIGIDVSIGVPGHYAGQDVIFNSRYLSSMHSELAQVNSVFVTHIDDRSKAIQLRLEAKHFNSFVCMSPSDANALKSILGPIDGVVGLNLPPRSYDVRPVKLAYMSRYYKDNRKCEDWILDYFSNHNPEAKFSFIFSFLGYFWEEFAPKLEQLNLSYELVRYSSEMPSEYTYYKEKLQKHDYLIYLGDDGGAMSVYDAVAAGIKVICRGDSYHMGLPASVELFNDKAEFFQIMDRIFATKIESERILRQRSVENYTQSLLHHWNSILSGDRSDKPGPVKQMNVDLECKSPALKTPKFRRMTYARFRWAVIRILKKYI